MGEIEELTAKILAFADERDWRKFHTPKDLAMGVSIEAGELLECFQWERRIPMPETRDEIADVCIYLFELAHILNVDLRFAIEDKLSMNAVKYPKEKAWGSNKKYDKL